jgi:hypothetical protein
MLRLLKEAEKITNFETQAMIVDREILFISRWKRKRGKNFSYSLCDCEVDDGSSGQSLGVSSSS